MSSAANMPDSEDRAQVEIQVLSDLEEVPPDAWNALTGGDDPFCEHGFLSALERSGSVGAKSGWDPLHVTVWREGRLIAGLPLYLKDHSYGEYIFDWAWADAAMRVGERYYPKLVSMIPVTPATGRRLLYAEGEDPDMMAALLLEGALVVARKTNASSLHLLFVTEDEKDRLSGRGEMLPRLTHQYHWHNQGWGSFDEFLGSFRSSMRKQVKRERRKVAETGLRIETKTGPELTDEDWAVLPQFYRDTCRRKGSYPYLTKSFFSELQRSALERVVCVLAYDGGRPVAATLNFEKGGHLYGRYWGCLDDYEMLHFELCYYRLIERAIEKRMTRFEAGAQGTHKLRRGLVPSEIHSVHWLRHPVLADAVADYLPREAASVREQIDELALHGPFRRGEIGG